MVRDGAAGAGHGRRVPAALLDAGTGEELEAAGDGSEPVSGGEGRAGLQSMVE
jgi:hypothetical protein